MPPCRPGGKAKAVPLETAARFAVDWLNQSTGNTVAGKPVAGGADREFTAPFPGDVVSRS